MHSNCTKKESSFCQILFLANMLEQAFAWLSSNPMLVVLLGVMLWRFWSSKRPFPEFPDSKVESIHSMDEVCLLCVFRMLCVALCDVLWLLRVVCCVESCVLVCVHWIYVYVN